LAAVERQVLRALDEAAALQGQARWPEALEAAGRAQGLLRGDSREDIRQRAAEVKNDLEMALRLEEIRLPDAVSSTKTAEQNTATDARLSRAFRDYGIDMEALEPADAAERVRASSIRQELVLALDHWVKTRTSMPAASRQAKDGLRARLLAVARAADPDQWRNLLRDTLEDRRGDQLIKLAASTQIGDLPLQSLSLLGWALDRAGAAEQAVSVLRQAQQRYPDDFTINFQLAWSLDHGQHRLAGQQRKDDVIRFYTVARALRPRNVPVHLFLGHTLGSKGKLEEAIGMYRRAIELGPDEVLHHYWLALAQLAVGDLDGYRATCATLLRQFGKSNKAEVVNAAAWTIVLADGSVADPEKAVTLARVALRTEPGSDLYANTLAAALYRAGRLEEAMRCFHEIAAAARQGTKKLALFSPAYTWFFLAMTQRRMSQTEEARKSLALAIQTMEREADKESTWWTRRATLQLLRREAEALVREQKP
jgi:serine/threonine-protein kinase